MEIEKRAFIKLEPEEIEAIVEDYIKEKFSTEGFKYEASENEYDDSWPTMRYIGIVSGS